MRNVQQSSGSCARDRNPIQSDSRAIRSDSPGTTIGAEGLDGRVWDGNGWVPLAKVTGIESSSEGLSARRAEPCC